MSWWEWFWQTKWWGIPVAHWAGAALLLILGYFVARILAHGLSRLFYLALGTARQDISSEQLHRLMRPAWLLPLFLIVAYSAGAILRFFHISPEYVEWIRRIFQALAFLAFALVGSRLLAVAETILASRYKAAGETYKLQLVHPLFTIGRIVLFLLVGFLMIEHTLKINVAPFFTTLGLGGLAVALAAQETLQHFFGAIVIFSDKPFQVGDLIRIDNNLIGTVERIGLRSTHIRTLDNLLLIIPNKKLTDSPLENLTQVKERRILFRIGVLYSTPSAVLESLLQDLRRALEALPFLSRPPSVFFTNFLDSALEVTVIVFYRTDYKVDESDPSPIGIFYFQDQVAWTILRTVRKYEPQTTFAFPTRTIYVESFPQPHHALSEAARHG
ncbi:MAG: mechanosensitive ion channel family protein [Bacteroidia bacterium]|nr:mechanosensitive ion channel family protein [Bacteroidia bacterium]MDW8235298.1 mechanosensitive ion channel family protein [Bacteroidia bacterium]